MQDQRSLTDLEIILKLSSLMKHVKYIQFSLIFLLRIKKCTEPRNIIPLQYSPKKLILIGDPMQLPATTFSSDSVATKFNRSLFEVNDLFDLVIIFNREFLILESNLSSCTNNIEWFLRFESSHQCVFMRTGSLIIEYFNINLCNNRLKDAGSISQRPYPPYLANFENRNILFLDLKYSKEKMVDHSYINTAEIK